MFIQIISLPKGVNARPASLKCCLAKGIPIMVMANSTPKNTWVRHIQNPPIKIHIRFMTVDKQPEFPGLSLI